MKYLFNIINILLVAAIVYFGVDIIFKNELPETTLLPENHSPGAISKNISLQQATSVFSRNQYDIIVARNIFKVEIEDKKAPVIKQETEDDEFEKLEPTRLKLVLWGTVTGDSDVYAVIEDKKMRKQSLYEEGDSIQGAKIKKILRHKVILTYQGEDQILKMETDRKKTALSKLPVIKPLMYDSLDDMSALRKQVKFRPHFTEGEPDGLMVYGIRSNSVFRRVGLRNGDIIKDVNGIPIISAGDASSLFSEIEDTGNARITLLRKGKVKELVYPAEDGELLKNKGEE
ncbi:type II secretion system protein N [Desulfobacula sp.]|uniref:type II secretion system protein N n=1 Tax=Desulfobacula sp. TaxID=2593537 RepID=UPI0025C69650|nr:type II secretion system protein N [Desulfobacula sp.]MBC2704559.1 hypothetical protein [Desulfobacula sp.]